MSLLDRLEEEYVDVSTSRASLRELLGLLVGAVAFVLVAAALTDHLLGGTAALVVAAALALVFGITLVSQAYWAVAGRDDYRE